MAYEGGFQIGKEIGAINIPSMDKELMFYTQLNASKLAAEKKAEADKQKNINKIIEEQRKENAEWVYEDKIDDVGLEQADQAAAKLQQQIKNGYERDTYLYSVGALSQTDYTRNNTKRKASVKEIQSLYSQANTFIKEKNDLVASGNDNYVNDLKAEVMGDLMKHAAFKNNTDGRTEVSTINTRGQRTNLFSSTLKDVSTAEKGLKPDDIVNKLVTEAGFIKYDSVSGKYRYTDYATGKMSGSNKERTGRLLDAAFEGYTDTQYIDLANRLGLVSDDKEEAEKEGLIHVDATNFLRKSPEEIQEIKKRAKDGVSQYFTDRLELKQDRGMAPKPTGTGTPKYRNRGDGFFIVNQKTPLQFKDMEGVFDVDMDTNNMVGDAMSYEKGFIEAVKFHPKDKDKKLTDKRMYAEIIVPDDTGQKGSLVFKEDENGNQVLTLGGSEVAFTRKRVLLDPKDPKQASQILNVSSYLGIQKKELPKPYQF
jgi:hypothetical protein